MTGCGDEIAAEADYAESLRSGDSLGIPVALWGLAMAETACGKPDLAAMLHGSADAWHYKRGEEVEDPLDLQLRESDRRTLRAELADDAFERAHARGRGMQIIEVLALLERTPTPAEPVP